MRPSSNQALLIRQLLPYFKMFPLDRMSWSTGGPIPFEKELKKWRTLPQSYLSHQEIISVCQSWCLEVQSPKSRLELIDYIEAALSEQHNQYRASLHFLLALTHFELAISLPRQRQGSHLRLAQMSFDRAKRDPQLELSSELHHIIVLVARDQLLVAVKMLHQLSKREFIEGQAVAFSVWKTLEKIYQALNRPHWAEFYRHKWQQQRLPLGHHFTVRKAS